MVEPTKRKFGGKIYSFRRYAHGGKAIKDNIVRALREKGYLVRTVKGGTYRQPIWNVYTRKK